MRKPQAPLYTDPLYNGASDPTLIWNREEKQWWMVYTQRRPTLPGPGVAWVHGADLGVASSPDGHNWLYRGTLRGLDFEPGRNTWWAPEILWHGGQYHMYASYIQGVPQIWAGRAQILHYTSPNLWDWTLESQLELGSQSELGSQRVIDACVAPLPAGGWRMWYKDEDDNASSHYADSGDLFHWQPKGRAVDFGPHEGPNVFWLGGHWWYIGDFWRGQGVFRGDDSLSSWDFRGYILDKPGTRADDRNVGLHADVVVQGEEAYVFYFTHPRREMERQGEDRGEERFTSVQVARITTDGEVLLCDRDAAYDFALLPPADRD